MYLSDILNVYGVDQTKKIKLVRHKDTDKNYDLEMLYNIGMIEFYQSIQSNDVFKSCDYIISFMGEEGTKSRFIGMYKVVGKLKFKDVLVPEDFPYKNMYREEMYYYKLEKTNLLLDLENRLIINWGKGTIQWNQWLDKEKEKDKLVYEILPEGYSHPFPGYEDVCLSFKELSTIINNPITNKKWCEMLSAVFGVYLIVDTLTGEQYVGSAYGEKSKGLWGRWEQYIKTKHGGNKNMIKLLENDPNRYNYFQFAILRTLPKSLTSKEVIAYEQKYKKILGSRAFGLNSN